MMCDITVHVIHARSHSDYKSLNHTHIYVTGVCDRSGTSIAICFPLDSGSVSMSRSSVRVRHTRHNNRVHTFKRAREMPTEVICVLGFERVRRARCARAFKNKSAHMRAAHVMHLLVCGVVLIVLCAVRLNVPCVRKKRVGDKTRA